MNNYLTERIQMYQLIFRNQNQKPILLNQYQVDRVKQKWADRINPIEVGDYAFSYSEIKEIVPIGQKNNKNIKEKYERSEYIADWNRKKAIADQWIKDNPEYWIEALKLAKNVLIERGDDIMPPSMFKKIQEAQARILCEIAITFPQ